MNLASLIDLEEASEYCRINADVLSAWVTSSHAPHYFVDNKGPLFMKSEIRDWVVENLVKRKGGMPIPKQIDVLTPIGSKAQAAPPTVLSNIDSLCLLSLNGMVSGIYFLCKGEQVVYVGQSTRVVARISSHIGEGIKDFDPDRVFFLPCPKPMLDDIERQYIVALQPRYNGNKLGQNKLPGQPSVLSLPSPN